MTADEQGDDMFVTYSAIWLYYLCLYPFFFFPLQIFRACMFVIKLLKCDGILRTKRIKTYYITKKERG